MTPEQKERLKFTALVTIPFAIFLGSILIGSIIYLVGQ